MVLCFFFCFRKYAVIISGFHCSYSHFQQSFKPRGHIHTDVMTVFANSFSYANGSVQDSRHSRSKIAFSPFLTVNTLLCLLIYMFSSFYEHDNVILMFFLDFFLKAKLIADSEGFLPDKNKRELCIFNEAFSIAKADLVYYHLTFGTFSSFFLTFI